MDAYEKYDLKSDERLYRWLHPSQFKWDERRPTSAAFSTEYMSVDIAALTSLEESYQRSQLVKDQKGVSKYNAVVSFNAELVLAAEQKISHCKSFLDEQEQPVCITEQKCSAFKAIELSELKCINPAHACVIGKKKKSLCKKLAKKCDIEIYPSE